MANDDRLFYSVRSSTTFSVITVGVGIICDSFLYAFVVPLLPSFLEHRTHVSPQDIQWAISLTLTVYGLCASLGSPFAGFLADQVPRRSIPFLAGLAFSAAGTAMFMTVRTLPLLIVARALQGFGTTIVWTVGLAMLLERVGAARMGVTVGSIFGFLGAAQLAAPALGGWLYEKAGVVPLTSIALGIVAADFLMRVAVIEVDNTDECKLSVDDGTNESMISGASDHPDEETQHNEIEQTPLLAVNRSEENTKTLRYPLPKQLPSYASSFPILILIQDPRLIAAEVLTFAHACQFAAIDATLPQELASRLGWSSGPISLMILPWILPFMIFDPIFGRLIDRIGAKAPCLVGISSWAAVLLLMRIPILLLENGRRSLGIGVWAALMVLNGVSAAAVGSGGIVVTGQVAEGYLKEHPDLMIRKGGKGPYAQLYAINSIVFHAGLAVGPAAAGALRTSMGYANMQIVLSLLEVVTGVICYVYMDGWPVCGRGYELQPDLDDQSST